MRRSSCALLVTAVLAVSLGATSCGGGGGSGDPNLVLLAFNKPNVAGIALNEPLIFTFSNSIEESSITPDTLRVTGTVGPFFETTVVDGNLVALLPRSPNFEDYSDAGYGVSVAYSVDFAVFPAPSTITTPSGKPLLDAEGYMFTTLPTPVFVEPRRPINNGLSPAQGGRSDGQGCLQNPDNSLYDGQVQFGSGPGARLLCLKNEGPPRVILDECSPTFGDSGVGTPSAVTEGTINLPALRVRYNEPLDPITVVPYIPTSKIGLNVQLWRVGDTDKVPIPPEPIRTNKPLIVQSLDQTETILVASNEDEFGNPIGGVLQGTYLINITQDVTDLPGNPLVIADTPDPDADGFGAVDDSVNASGFVAPGYRIYFVTLRVPGTAQSFNEGFNTNLNEWGDALSGDTEPGIFETSNPTTDLRDPIPGTDVDAPSYTLTYDILGSGQSTSANWNGGFRFLGLDGLQVNTDLIAGNARLQPSFRPWTGTGVDGDFDSGGGGSITGLGTDPVPGNSLNGDGIYEYTSFNLRAGDILSVSGSRPLVILCRGDVTLDGTIEMNGTSGGPGLDTDGSDLYTEIGSAQSGGEGGEAGPGGGQGGTGADVVTGLQLDGEDGGGRTSIFGNPGDGNGLGGEGAEAPDQQSGSGGGLAAAGGDGATAAGDTGPAGGPAIGDSTLGRDLARFMPDRTYSPNADISGGTGGGGGGAEDTNGNSQAENGDAGGGGGGGAGGCLYVIAAGTVSVGGTIHCNGGDGGSTFAAADQQIDLGNDGAPGGSGENADRVVGVIPGSSPSGAGGPGGGGSGGVVFLMGAEGVGVAATASLSATAGTGGGSGDTDLVGGDGSAGKIVLGALPGNPITVDGSASVTPGEQQTEYRPTVDGASSGVSQWYDMFTNTAVFDPPQYVDNFQSLIDAGLILGVEFDAVLEFQGAANLSPLPGGLTPPSTASGLTQWNADPASINGKRYIRYRWRFTVVDYYPVDALTLPAILDLVIPFTR